MSERRKGKRNEAGGWKRPQRKLVAKKGAPKSPSKNKDEIRLNKFIANAGVCSRREADVLIEAGAITVNGKPVTQVGTKVTLKDEVRYGDELLTPRQLVYILLNKPKDFAITSKDQNNRRTVFFLIRNATHLNVVNVGKLDRHTTGVLLFTNDGELSKKLTLSKNKVPQMFHVTTDKKINPVHIDQLKEGVRMVDGKIQAKEISFVGKDQKQVGIEIHSGRNGVVKKVFEHFGYKIVKLDRVEFARLGKKNLKRGDYRKLTDLEIANLRMLPV